MACRNLVLLLALVLCYCTTSHAQVDLGVQISGNVSCTATGNPVAGGANTGAANATVSLLCGNNTIATTVTDNNGTYGINATASISDLPSLRGGRCRVTVNLPVAGCPALNVSGALVSSVGVSSITQLPNNSISASLVPGMFQLESA